ncbi:MAG: O-antigen flippase, partial [Desulforhopalus sp.]
AEILKVYRFVMPIVITGAIAIFLLRDFIIRVLFTEDFYPMRELFPWQLTGDVIKIGSWVLAYIMIARSMVKLYIINEILFSLLFYLLSWFLVGLFGLVGVPMAYAINYSLYWFAMVYFLKSEMK